MSGLLLNFGKTVLVPLYQFDEVQVREIVATNAPDWGGVCIAKAAKYLGYFVGPGKGTESWTAPLQKFRERAKQWGRLGLGWLLTVQAYQVYIASVLQFVAQLEPLPDGFEMHERAAVQALFPGPRAWIVPTCLKDAAYFHMPTALVDMVAIAHAAKVRVRYFENEAMGGLHVHRRATRLMAQFGDTCSLSHIAWCVEWGRRSFLHNLVHADSRFIHMTRRQPVEESVMESRDGFQKHITPLLRSIAVGSSMVHLRRRLDYWSGLMTLPGHRTGKVRIVMSVLQRRANPRVQAAYLRTVCNGWCTRRRFQDRAATCTFGCGRGMDSVEHFARCPLVGQLFDRNSRLQAGGTEAALDSFLILNDLHDEEKILSRGIGLYALYRLHNGIRHGLFTQEEVYQAFGGFMREAVS